MKGGGQVLAVEIDGGKEEAFRFQNALRIIRISNNLGDVKSLITHPTTTTHSKLKPATRAELGISDGLVRLSIGLEAVEDLKADLDVALAAIRESLGYTSAMTPVRRRRIHPLWTT